MIFFSSFAGTKWCGKGNSAAHFDDLGVFPVEDSCCREHDHCRDFIISGGSNEYQTKRNETYHINNENIYTM